jgi:phospholipid/cholesterol/gamma-HCH transport system substrate-binding protein
MTKKPSLDRELTTELIVGAFMFLILLVIGYFTIILSRENIFRRTYPFDVTFSNVMGLRRGDNVVIRGMIVGKIKELELADSGVRVVCTLDLPVALKKDYRVSITPTSILGGRMLEINAGSSAELLPKDREVRGTDPYDLLAEATEAIHEIRSALSDGKILENLEATMAEVRQISEKLNRGEGTLGKLFADDTVYRDLQSILQDGRDAVAQLKDITAKVGRGEGTLGKLLTDEGLYTNLQAVAVNIREISQRLADGQGTLGKLLSTDDTVYKDLAATVASLKDITTRIERGEGSLGKIVRDDALYTEIKQTVEEARAAVDDFRETAPITTFTSIFFGAF